MLKPGERCNYCESEVNLALERNVPDVSHTIRIWCGCKEATSIFKDADFYAGLTHNQAINLVYCEWAKKNPASEESGVDEEKIWNAVLEAMRVSYILGSRQRDVELETILKTELDRVIGTDRPGPFLTDGPAPTRKP